MSVSGCYRRTSSNRRTWLWLWDFRRLKLAAREQFLHAGIVDMFTWQRLVLGIGHALLRWRILRGRFGRFTQYWPLMTYWLVNCGFAGRWSIRRLEYRGVNRLGRLCWVVNPDSRAHRAVRSESAQKHSLWHHRHGSGSFPGFTPGHAPFPNITVRLLKLRFATRGGAQGAGQ